MKIGEASLYLIQGVPGVGLQQLRFDFSPEKIGQRSAEQRFGTQKTER